MHSLNSWLICFLVLLAGSLEAQEVRLDILWLRTGEKLEGKVSTSEQGDLIKIILKESGDTLLIKRHDIDRMEQNVILSQEEIRTYIWDQLPTQFNLKKTYWILSIMAGFGGDEGTLGAGLRGGYRFPKGLELGMTFHYYGMDGWGRGLVPLGLEARLPFLKSKSGRFVSMVQLNSGYTFSLQYLKYVDEYREFIVRGDGFYFQPGLAFRTNFTKNFGLMFDICYFNLRSPKQHWRFRNTLALNHEHFFLTRLGLFF